jgi:hypothetical protein
MFKKATWLVVALAAAAMFPVLPAWSGTLPSSIIPDDARWIAHLDMGKFVGTKLYEYLDKEGRFMVKSRDFTHWLRIDSPKDIVGLTIFGLGPAEKENVFVISGKLDQKRLLSLLSLSDDYQEVPYGGYTLHLIDDGAAVFLNDGLIVYSASRKAVEKVLDTAAGKAKNFAASRLNAAMKEVPPNAFVSAVFEDLAALDMKIRQSKLLEKVSGLFFMAQEKDDNLQAQVRVTADSPESAADMADIVQGIVALARMNNETRVASLLDGLQVKLDGKAVRLEFSLPSREVAGLISSGRMPHGFFN